MRKMKGFGGSFVINGKSQRGIIASDTIKKAVEILAIVYIPYYYFKDYWCETGNAKELKIALKQPYNLFCKDIDDIDGEYKIFNIKD